MKKILIDIDEVICDNVYIKCINRLLGTNKKPEECNEYHAEDNFDISQEKIREYHMQLGKENPYKFAVIFKDCKDVIEQLNSKYEVYICSAVVLKENIMASRDYYKYKFNFLIENFPFLDPNKFIFTTNKTIIQADIIIDDKPSNLINSITKTKYIYTAQHNKNLTDKELKKFGIKRVNNWKEIKGILL